MITFIAATKGVVDLSNLNTEKKFEMEKLWAIISKLVLNKKTILDRFVSEIAYAQIVNDIKAPGVQTCGM
jgi:hypothetical protein